MNYSIPFSSPLSKNRGQLPVFMNTAIATQYTRHIHVMHMYPQARSNGIVQPKHLLKQIHLNFIVHTFRYTV